MRLFILSVLATLLVVLLSAPPTDAEEGLWLPQQLPALAEALEQAGLELDPQVLADRDRYPLAAVVSLADDCSASFISPRGLVLTNHHCLIELGMLSSHSTEERDLVADGFLARTPEEELAATPGVELLLPHGAPEDVTAKILSGLEGLDTSPISQAVRERAQAIKAECEEPGKYRCRVVPVYQGVRFALLRRIVVPDLRVVYAPPMGVGFFGGDIGNFEWPRHAGDFALLRAYVDADGKPAPPGPDNRPLEPEHWLRIASEPAGPGDFVMVPGFPRVSDRWAPPRLMGEQFDIEYRLRLEQYDTWLDAIEAAGRVNPEAARTYDSYTESLNTGRKFVTIMLESFENADVHELKLRTMQELEAWIHSSPERVEAYGEVVARHREAVEARVDYRELDIRFRRLEHAAALLDVAKKLDEVAREGSGDPEAGDPIDDPYHELVDRAVLRAYILAYHENLPVGRRRADFDEWFGLEPGKDATERVDELLDRMYAETRLDEPKVRMRLLEATPEELEASEDPFIQLAIHLQEGDRAAAERRAKQRRDIVASGKDYRKALLDYFEHRDEPFYPDANRSLRLTYGNIPEETDSRQSFTTAQGILDKSTGEAPFDTPPEVLRPLREKRFGPYRDPRLKSLPINFCSSVDVVDGNSGSPTLDSRGELVGLLFDNSRENLITAWGYKPPSSACAIHVDIRYLLWLLDEVHGAERLVDEMTGESEESPLERERAEGER